MTVSAEERVLALREAVERGDWGSFDATLESWPDDAPDAAWKDVGKSIAHLARGESLSESDLRAVTEADERLGQQVTAIDGLIAGNTDIARDAIVAELANGAKEPEWIEAYRSTTSATEDAKQVLYNSPHLVAACVLSEGDVKSMAAKGSRMSADSLGQWTDAIWNEIRKLNKQIPIGKVRSMQVAAEDGGWVMVSDGNDPALLVTALVAAPTAAAEVFARANAVVAMPEEAV